MHVEDIGYWQDVSMDADMSLRDPGIVALFYDGYESTEVPPVAVLAEKIHQLVFEHKPPEHLTLIDAANILALSMSFQEAQGMLLPESADSPEAQLAYKAAYAYSRDVATAVLGAYAAFTMSSFRDFREYIKEEFRITPCPMSSEGREESIFVLTMWLSHYDEVADYDLGEVKFGRISIPRPYGRGFCFPALKKFAMEDARLRKKIPALVGASPTEIEAYLRRIKKEAA